MNSKNEINKGDNMGMLPLGSIVALAGMSIFVSIAVLAHIALNSREK